LGETLCKSIKGAEKPLDTSITNANGGTLAWKIEEGKEKDLQICLEV